MNHTFNILGLKISVLNMLSAIDVIDAWLTENTTGRYICLTNTHGVVESLYNVTIRDAFLKASSCLPDGMPLAWIGRSRGHRHMDRVYGPDLMLEMLKLSAEKGYTNYLCGGHEGVAEKLSDVLKARFPSLKMVGTSCPPFRAMNSEEESALIDEMNANAPDMIWVCLGAPKQELFMAKYASRLNTKVMIGVGAAFEIHVGSLKQAPSWMQNCGMEWLFRLCVEPRRLWRRYFKNNPLFLFHIFLESTGLKKYPLEQENHSP
jgi:N-acetylglucosaminyldiphosphoundecaprenol N-acetyl-beta-D-mannosaminyltransferase